MTTTVGAIGPLRVEITGTGPLAAELRQELSPADRGTVDLRIVLADRGEVMRRMSPATYSAKRHMAFGVDRLTADDPLRYGLFGLFQGSPTELVIESQTERPFSRFKRSLGPQIGMHPVLTYSLLWYVAHVLLVRRGDVSIHASAWEEAGTGVAIAGTGGSGKTSLLFHLLDTRPAVRYLGEDFTIVDAAGRLVLSPKSVSVFSSDLQTGAIRLDDYRGGMGAWRRLRWMAWRSLGTTPMIKIPVAAALAPERIGDGAPLGSLVYLIRSDIERPVVEPVAPADVIARLLHVGWREHKRLLELLHMVSANAGTGVLIPTPDAFEEAERVAFGAAMGGARAYLARVPARASPDMIANALRDAGAIP